MKEFDLHDSLIFKGVEEKYLQNFLSSCEIVDLKKGESLFHQNELGDAMYVIESGELQVMFDQNIARSGSKVIETLTSGGLIGELCVFGQQKRSASISASINSRLLKIEGEDFRARVFSKELDALLICYNIAQLLCDRLSATNARLSFHP